jgi:hypothetical protein
MKESRKISHGGICGAKPTFENRRFEIASDTSPLYPREYTLLQQNGCETGNPERS